MDRKPEATAVMTSIDCSFRRLGHSLRPLCAGALALGLVQLAMPAAQAQTVRPLLMPAPAPPATQVAAVAAPAATPVPSPPPLDAPLERLRKAADVMAEVNAELGPPRSPYGQLIYDIALRHSVNPHLVAAMIHVESAFNPRAVSRKGARGLMQLLPATARRFGLTKKRDLFDPTKNLEAGVRYLEWLTQRFAGDVEKILAAYNAGEGAVERFGGIPPYRETQQYVTRVFGLLGITVDTPTDPVSLPQDLVSGVPAGL